jgi:hypothetical protein
MAVLNWRDSAVEHGLEEFADRMLSGTAEPNAYPVVPWRAQLIVLGKGGEDVRRILA